MTKLNEQLLNKGIDIVISSGETTKTDETKTFYRFVLDNIQNEELRLGKYYHQFRYDEIIQMLKRWEITTIASIKTINTVMSQYLQFYIDEGLADIKYAIFLRTEDLIDAIYNEHEHLYFTSDVEFTMFIQSFCQNSQDAIIFNLLFEGVNGIRSQEIRNLRVEDVDFNSNTLTLKQDDRDGLGQTRTLKGSNLLMNALHDAIHDDIYYKNNGQASIDNKTEYFEIESNGYVIRNSGRPSYDPVGQHIIQQRVKKISTLYGKDKLSPRNVMMSGMILKLKKIELENGKVTNDDIKKVHTDYNLNPDTWYSTKKTYDSVNESFNVQN